MDDKNIETLLDQLKNNETIVRRADKIQEEFNLSPDDLEQFIVNNSGRLIKESMSIIQDLKDTVVSSGDAEQTEALSALIGSTSGAIEVLNKILIQRKKSENNIKVKQMDIDARKELKTVESNTNINVLVSTREDLVKKLFNEVSNIIDIDSQKVTEETKLLTSSD